MLTFVIAIFSGHQDFQLVAVAHESKQNTFRCQLSTAKKQPFPSDSAKHQFIEAGTSKNLS
jgi:hypothetical protein